MAQLTFNSKEEISQTNEFPVEMKRTSISSWGCPFIGSGYLKKYKVGQGSYGFEFLLIAIREVYKAIQIATSSIFAIKKMSLERSTEGFPIAALNEIKILKHLSHPNIIRLVDVAIAKYAPSERLHDTTKACPFLYPWNFFMVCEYAEHSLSGLIERRTTFNQSEIKCLFKQVLEGLAYLHSKGIMHRDIKCSNILVNSSGVAKLADFGISTQFTPMLLQDGKKPVATLWYRAPELLTGQNYTEAIDMWGMGCVLGELILGKAVFMGKNPKSQLETIQEELSDGKLWTKLAFL
jgi:serine/threonine protein kinase